jgi:hypothetical protein
LPSPQEYILVEPRDDKKNENKKEALDSKDIVQAKKTIVKNSSQIFQHIQQGVDIIQIRHYHHCENITLVF